MNAGKTIKQLRLKVGYKQSYIASHLKVTQGYYSLIERDLAPLKLSQLLIIIHILGVSIQDILGES